MCSAPSYQLIIHFCTTVMLVCTKYLSTLTRQHILISPYNPMHTYTGNNVLVQLICVHNHRCTSKFVNAHYQQKLSFCLEVVPTAAAVPSFQNQFLITGNIYLFQSYSKASYTKMFSSFKSNMYLIVPAFLLFV